MVPCGRKTSPTRGDWRVRAIRRRTLPVRCGASGSESILRPVLARSIERLNPSIPEEAREDALAKLMRDAHLTLIENNRRFHGFPRDGVPVEFRHFDGSIRHDSVRLIDFKQAASNEFLEVEQFTIIEKSERRPDIIIFVNGLPLVVMELKHPTSPGAEVQNQYSVDRIVDEITTAAIGRISRYIAEGRDTVTVRQEAADARTVDEAFRSNSRKQDGGYAASIVDPHGDWCVSRK
jgi:hypothetical protein